MYPDILSILRCPCCGGRFRAQAAVCEQDEIVEGSLVCEQGHSYPIQDGVVCFGAQEQAGSNTWSEYYKEADYDEVDRAIDSRKTPAQLDAQQKLLDAITAQTSQLESGFLLDIASGRGMLLRQLLKTTSAKVHIIATDLSYPVLKFDRIKLRAVNPNVRVSYLACDATDYPIRDNSVDMACTFAGLLNMQELMERGLQDAHRILKPGSLLVNSTIYQQDGTAAFQALRRLLEENGPAKLADYCLRGKLLEVHRNIFASVEDEIACEGIAEAMEGDLLPLDGEWFANAVILAGKERAS